MLSYLPESIAFPYKKDVSKGFKVYEGSHVATMQMIMTTYTWSPIIWKDGHRTKKNFVRAHYIGLDFENPEVPMTATIKRYCDSWHLLGTTRSHGTDKQPLADRYRLLLKLKEPITRLADYECTVGSLIEHNGCDASGIDGARIFYPCRVMVSIACDDDLFLEETIKGPTDEEVAKQRAEFEKRQVLNRRDGTLSRFALRCLLNEMPQGERSNNCWKLGKELAAANYTYDDALARILASPTYKGKEIDRKTMYKIRDQLARGFKDAYNFRTEINKKTNAP